MMNKIHIVKQTTFSRMSNEQFELFQTTMPKGSKLSEYHLLKQGSL